MTLFLNLQEKTLQEYEKSGTIKRDWKSKSEVGKIGRAGNSALRKAGRFAVC
jgi:hypothetical protein